MSPETFEQMVSEALAQLPKEFQEKLHNVAVTIEDEPSWEQIRKMRLQRNMTLFGLYEGIPQTKRGSNYTMVLPDKITIFQKPIEDYYQTPEEIKHQVRSTVLHEIGHHFGMSDKQLRKLNY